jgi:hypothetical protein
MKDETPMKGYCRDCKYYYTQFYCDHPNSMNIDPVSGATTLRGAAFMRAYADECGRIGRFFTRKEGSRNENSNP